MARIKIQELPGRFEQLEREYLINQANGKAWAIGLYAERLNENLKKFRSMCGMCCGAHLAEMAGTPLDQMHWCGYQFYEELTDRLDTWKGITPKRIDKLIDNEGKEVANGLANQRLYYRDYHDGVRVLANALRRGRHFKEWCRKTSATQPFNEEYQGLRYVIGAKKILKVRSREELMNLDFSDVQRSVQRYLYDNCGAPAACFSGETWPRGKAMSKVMAKVLELNPNIAALPL